MRCTTSLLALAPLCGVVGCADNPVSSIVCTGEYRAGISVTVVDSVTGAAPEEATLVARAPNFVDSVGPVSPYQPAAGTPPILVLSAAGERPGTYSLVVRSPGYHDWTRAGVVVTADVCHVHTVTLAARLQGP